MSIENTNTQGRATSAVIAETTLPDELRSLRGFGPENFEMLERAANEIERYRSMAIAAEADRVKLHDALFGKYGVESGIEVVEKCLQKAIAAAPEDAPFPLLGNDAKLYMRAQMEAYRHSLEMISLDPALKSSLTAGNFIKAVSNVLSPAAQDGEPGHVASSNRGIAAILAASPLELLQMDLQIVARTLGDAQSALEKATGGRQSWLDGAVAIAHDRAANPLPQDAPKAQQVHGEMVSPALKGYVLGFPEATDAEAEELIETLKSGGNVVYRAHGDAADAVLRAAHDAEHENAMRLSLENDAAIEGPDYGQ
ncbi:hypothetical protein RCH14_004451 [Massilia sp. MP_M2]|uniref:hypothetical protein n=1 Tax=Massilia sp. MP_M2 TaxID=3071713 RepID=UPI00319D95DC